HYSTTTSATYPLSLHDALPIFPTVAADHDRILQVFSNLIDNAIKFTPRGGRVTVRAEGGDHEVVFSISDTGPGIPQEQLAHLFRSEEHTSELQSRENLVCRLLL